MGKLALTRIPDLAKVGVEGSNPFARSSNSLKSQDASCHYEGGLRSPAQNAMGTDPGNAGKIREACSRCVLGARPMSGGSTRSPISRAIVELADQVRK